VSKKDFRYTMPDGSEIEGFQMTKAARYQQKHWPDWMDSRFLVSYSHGEQRLNINDVEQKVPDFGWIIKDATGTIKAVDYTVMENAEKVVKEVDVVHPEQPVDEEALLELAAKLTKRPIEELRAEEEERKAKKKPAPPPTLKAVEGRPAVADSGLGDFLNETRLAYMLFKEGHTVQGIDKLGAALSARQNWCDCPPGRCADKVADWDCRQKSPLA